MVKRTTQQVNHLKTLLRPLQVVYGVDQKARALFPMAALKKFPNAEDHLCRRRLMVTIRETSDPKFLDLRCPQSRG